MVGWIVYLPIGCCGMLWGCASRLISQEDMLAVNSLDQVSKVRGLPHWFHNKMGCASTPFWQLCLQP